MYVLVSTQISTLAPAATVPNYMKLDAHWAFRALCVVTAGSSGQARVTLC